MTTLLTHACSVGRDKIFVALHTLACCADNVRLATLMHGNNVRHAMATCPFVCAILCVELSRWLQGVRRNMRAVLSYSVRVRTWRCVRVYFNHMS